MGCSESFIDHLPGRITQLREFAQKGFGKSIRMGKPSRQRLSEISSALLQEMMDKDLQCTFGPFVFQFKRILWQHYPEVTGHKFSKSWFRSLLNKNELRHKVKCGKKRGCDHEAARQFTDQFVSAISSLNISPHHLFNADETSFLHIPDVSRGVGLYGSKENSSDHESKTISTVLFCCSGDGSFKAPPFFLRATKHRCLSPHILSSSEDILEDEEEEGGE